MLLRCIDADVPNRCFKGTAWFKSAGSERDAALRAGVTAALDAGFRHIDEAEMYVLITVSYVFITVRSSYVLITVSYVTVRSSYVFITVSYVLITVRSSYVFITVRSSYVLITVSQRL